MIKLLVDTNVLFDYFAARHPFDREAELLLFGCAMNDYEIWVSSSQITDLFFLMTHGNERLTRDDTTQTLQHLRKHIRIASVTEADIDDALGSGWADIEDAAVFFVARRTKATYLVTRNKRDFAQSTIPVLTPGEFLEEFQAKSGIGYSEIAL